VGLVAVALATAQALAVYPNPGSGAAGLWLLVDLLLLAFAVRGRRWALNLLTAGTVFGALLFVTTGAFQVDQDSRYLWRGIALAVAAIPLVRAWRAESVSSID